MSHLFEQSSFQNDKLAEKTICLVSVHKTLTLVTSETYCQMLKTFSYQNWNQNTNFRQRFFNRMEQGRIERAIFEFSISRAIDFLKCWFFIIWVFARPFSSRLWVLGISQQQDDDNWYIDNYSWWNWTNFLSPLIIHHWNPPLIVRSTNAISVFKLKATFLKLKNWNLTNSRDTLVVIVVVSFFSLCFKH